MTGTRDQGRVTSDWRLSLIVISSKARNLFHRDQGLTLPPTCAAHFSAFLICLSYRLCPIPLQGTFP